MSLLKILNTIFLDPITSILEIMFYFVNFVSHSVTLTTIIVAIFINFMFMPISKHAETFHEKVYQNKLNIRYNKLYKKANATNYKNILNYLLLNLFKILFFIATFNFFTKLALFEEVNSGFFAKADNLIKLGSFKINILPLIMIALNIVLFALTYKSSTLKSKIELYSITALLFILLYNAPASIVLFWIITNAFYLLKFCLSKFKIARICFKYVTSVFGIILALSYIRNKHLLLLIVGLLLQIPIIHYLLKFKLLSKIKLKKSKKRIVFKIKKSQFIIQSALIVLILGVFIPSTYVAASPQEYINSSLFFNPLYYVFNSFLTAFGYMFVWLNIIYTYAGKKTKLKINKLLIVSIAIMLVNYMFFGLNLGIISSSLKYDTGVHFDVFEIIINTIVILAIIVIFSFTFTKIKDYISIILSLVILVLTTMSTFNIFNSAKQVDNYKNGIYTKSRLSYDLSTTGHNVVVIMLDRAFGQYVPFILNEKPELKEKFDGFTYYQNTISYGMYTNIAVPALLGGYEYTPVELNKRDEESLKDKTTEANLVMPRIFSDAGYNVTVSDPVYINHQYVADLSLYDKYKNINAFYSIGKFVEDNQIKNAYNKNMTNFFRFSFMKTLPLALQYAFYDEGNYNNVQSTEDLKNYGNQTTLSLSKSTGIKSTFMNNYLTITNMDTMTNITSDNTNTFLFISNDITHEETLLDAANNYTPNSIVDNTEYDKAHSDRFTLPTGEKLTVTTKDQMMHYHVNIAALIQLGNWFDYLKENGIYDNTRIIIASDHGRRLNSIESLKYENYSLEMYAPLLMVKDFNSTGFKTSQEFMTNADVATLATQNLGFEAKNPFSGKPITMNEKSAHPQYISASSNWDVRTNNGNTLEASRWFSFDSTKSNCNIYDLDNWSLLKQNVVLKSHSFN